MATPEAAQAAVEGAGSKTLKGRQLKVSEAREREAGGGGGGRSGGGGYGGGRDFSRDQGHGGYGGGRGGYGGDRDYNRDSGPPGPMGEGHVKFFNEQKGFGFVVPEDLFSPHGPELDIAALRAEARADPEFSDLVWGNFAADLRPGSSSK